MTPYWKCINAKCYIRHCSNLWAEFVHFHNDHKLPGIFILEYTLINDTEISMKYGHVFDTLSMSILHLRDYYVKLHHTWKKMIWTHTKQLNENFEAQINEIVLILWKFSFNNQIFQYRKRVQLYNSCDVLFRKSIELCILKDVS